MCSTILKEKMNIKTEYIRILTRDTETIKKKKGEKKL